jgi:hypothetical protein
MNLRAETMKNDLLTYIVGLLALALLILFLDLRDEVPAGRGIGLLPGKAAVTVAQAPDAVHPL